MEDALKQNNRTPEEEERAEEAVKSARRGGTGDNSHLNVRRMRQMKGMTLRQLSKASNLSLSYLSNYENGKVNITISSLKKIAEAIGAPVSDLLTDNQENDVVIVPKEARYTRVLYEAEGGTAHQHYLMYSSRAAMHVSVNHLPPHSDSGQPSSHYGEEFILAIHGTVTVILDDNSYEIEEGTMIYYRSTFFHKVANHQDSEVVFLQVNTPPTY